MFSNSANSSQDILFWFRHEISKRQASLLENLCFVVDFSPPNYAQYKINYNAVKFFFFIHFSFVFRVNWQTQNFLLLLYWIKTNHFFAARIGQSCGKKLFFVFQNNLNNIKSSSNKMRKRTSSSLQNIFKQFFFIVVLYVRFLVDFFCVFQVFAAIETMFSPQHTCVRCMGVRYWVCECGKCSPFTIYQK